jgi:hypothetical protein
VRLILRKVKGELEKPHGHDLSRWMFFGRSKKSYNLSLLLVDINNMQENKTELKRSLGLIDATSLVAGSMIGSEIFISAMAILVQRPGLVIWLVTGLITVAAALSYGELAE